MPNFSARRIPVLVSSVSGAIIVRFHDSYPRSTSVIVSGTDKMLFPFSKGLACAFVGIANAAANATAAALPVGEDRGRLGG